jgi:hypothetical protein
MRMLESCLFQTRLQNEYMNGLARHEAKSIPQVVMCTSAGVYCAYFVQKVKVKVHNAYVELSVFQNPPLLKT